MATLLSILKAFQTGNGAVGGISKYFDYPQDHDLNYADIETTVNDLVNENLGTASNQRLVVGTEAAPTVTLGNQLGSGFFQRGTGEMGYATSGTERWFIDADGEIQRVLFNGVQVVLSTPFSTTDDTTTHLDGPLSFDSATFDPNSMWNGSTTITIPKTGFYAIEFMLLFDESTGPGGSSAPQNRGCQIRNNGGQAILSGAVMAQQHIDITSTFFFADNLVSAFTYARYTASDALTFFAAQDIGVSNFQIDVTGLATVVFVG